MYSAHAQIVLSVPVDDEEAGHTLLGSVDYSWLFAYALALYLRSAPTLSFIPYPGFHAGFSLGLDVLS